MNFETTRYTYPTIVLLAYCRPSIGSETPFANHAEPVSLTVSCGPCIGNGLALLQVQCDRGTESFIQGVGSGKRSFLRLPIGLSFKSKPFTGSDPVRQVPTFFAFSPFRAFVIRMVGLAWITNWSYVRNQFQHFHPRRIANCAGLKNSIRSRKPEMTKARDDVPAGYT